MALLSVVILNYKVPLFVEQCLYSVQASMQGIETEVWVVDNNSGDDSLSYLQERFPWVQFIANPNNGGFSQGNNLALKRCSGKYVLLLNPDTVITEETLSYCYSFMETHPSVGVAGVKMINANGRVLPESKRGIPSPWASFCRMTGLYKMAPSSKFFNKYYMGNLSFSQENAIEVLTGAFMFMRKEALDKIGLLDEQFFMYGEDIDLSFRFLKAGYKVYYLPTPILHYKGEAEHAAQNRAKYVESFYGAMELFYKKHYSGKSISGLLICEAIHLKKKLAKRSKDKRAITQIPKTSQSVFSIPPEQMEHFPEHLLPPKGALVQVTLYPQNYLATLSFMEKYSKCNYTFCLHTSLSGRTIIPKA